MDAVDADDNLKGVIVRSRHIARSSFNIKVVSDLECFIRFRFLSELIGIISTLTPWAAGVPRLNQYIVDDFTATSTVLRLL